MRMLSSTLFNLWGVSHANYSTYISVTDIILTDLHHLALFHICYISHAEKLNTTWRQIMRSENDLWTLKMVTAQSFM